MSSLGHIHDRPGPLAVAVCHGRAARRAPVPGTTATGDTTAAATTPTTHATVAVPPPHAAAWPTAWRPDTHLSLALLTLLMAYLIAVVPLRRRWFAVARAPWWRIAAFVAGLAVFLSAVFSPLDEVGEEYLFLAHMLQHSMLIYVVPPLLLWGIPEWLGNAVLGNRVLRPFVRAVTHPLVAFALFNALLGMWHMPGFYEWALRDKRMHDLEHMSFLLTAVAKWWPIVNPMPRLLPGFRHAGMKILYVLGLAVAHMPLFFYLVFAASVRYPTYRQAPRLIPWLTPLEDQALGGILMQVFAALVYVAVIGVTFYRWGRDEADRPTGAPPTPAPVPARQP